MNQSLYHYEQKGDHLTIFKGKKKLHTPNGNVVIADTQQLAEKLITLLEQDADYTSCATPLCYHYTYCDLIAQYDVASVREDVKTCIKDNLYDDPLMLFHATVNNEQLTADNESAPGITEEQYNKMYETVLTDFLAKVEGLNMYQLVAIIVLYCSFESIVMSWRILSEAQGDREQFITDLKEYCTAEEVECPEDLSNILDAFLFYYNL